MGSKSRVAKWGSSLAIRIPKPVAEQWGVEEGSVIEIDSEGDRVVLRKRIYDLEEMLAQIDQSNLHPEWDTGPAVGREEW